ncbi:MAG: tol-pal system protein YbgF [Sutterella sp.]|nr:tol-pal system protein YbgF [Sutterella sp.]
MKLNARLLVGVLALSMVSSQAFAFADDDARKAILDLREQIKDLQQQLDIQQQAQLNFANHVTSLQEQNRRLTGRIEEMANALKNEQKSSRELFQNVDQRLNKVEPQQVTINGQTVTVQPEEKQAYEDAQAALANDDYKKALTLFTDFNRNWKESPYRPDALYWQGACSFALEDYKSTINIQNQLIREFPNDEKVPDAMVSVGSAQASLGNVKAAQATFNKVLQRFPKSEAAKTAKLRLKAITR